MSQKSKSVKRKVKSNSPISILVDIFSDLIALLEVHIRENDVLFDRFLKMRKKEISKEDYLNFGKDFMLRNDSDAAFFIYMFAKFERYLRIMLFVITRKKDIKEKFERKWETFIDNKDLSFYDLNAKDYYKKPKYKFENYEFIARSDGRDSINFIETISGIRKLSEKKNVVYLKHLTSYYWHKEIRNLLVHRGNKFDTTFVKTIKRIMKKNSLNPKSKSFNPSIQLRRLVLNQYSKKERFELDLNKKNKKNEYLISTDKLLEKLNGKVIRNDVIDLSRSLLFISAWLIYNNNQKQVDGFSPLTSPLGEMTKLNNDLNRGVLNIHEELINSLVITCHGSDIKKIADADKLNTLLEINLRTERVLKNLSKRFKGEELLKRRKEIKTRAKEKYEYYFQFNKTMPSNMTEVLDAFIGGSKKKYNEQLLKTNFKEIAFFYKIKDVNIVREWLLFNKYTKHNK